MTRLSILLVLFPSLLFSIVAQAEQGDVNGTYQVRLSSVSDGLLIKTCTYRGEISIAKDNYPYDSVYVLGTADRNVINVSGRVGLNFYIFDLRVPDPDPLHLEYETNVARFSDCPSSLYLIYNRLKNSLRQK